MVRPGRTLGKAHWLPFARPAQRGLLFVSFWGPALLLPGQLVHCPSSLPAAEAWRALAFSRLGPLILEAPFNGAGWSGPRKTSQGTPDRLSGSLFGMPNHDWMVVMGRGRGPDRSHVCTMVSWGGDLHSAEDAGFRWGLHLQ